MLSALEIMMSPAECESSSSKSSCTCNSESSDYAPTAISKIKKSISFGAPQIFLIPTRTEIASCIKDRCVRNASFSITNSESELSKLSLDKQVNFYNRVTVFPVPSRKDLKSSFNELWYTSDEISQFEKDTLAAYQEFIKKSTK